MNILRVIEHSCFVAGLIALSVFAFGYITPRVHAIEAIDTLQITAQNFAVENPDTSAWSQERIDAFQQAQSTSEQAIGVVRIPAVDIEAPVFAGTSDLILDRGVGWIPATRPLGANGNVGLAAHRDGFFRNLKNISLGDTITTQTVTGVKTYRVTGTATIDPDDVYVLEPTASSTLTLITCYPFYFVGSAPERFAVFATLVE